MLSLSFLLFFLKNENESKKWKQKRGEWIEGEIGGKGRREDGEAGRHGETRDFKRGKSICMDERRKLFGE